MTELAAELADTPGEASPTRSRVDDALGTVESTSITPRFPGGRARPTAPRRTSRRRSRPSATASRRSSTRCCRTCGTVIHDTGDFAKWITRKTAEQLAPEGAHVVHAFIDGWVDDGSVPETVPAAERVDPDAVAEEFLQLVEQDRDVWTFDVDFRPHGTTASGPGGNPRVAAGRSSCRSIPVEAGTAVTTRYVRGIDGRARGPRRRHLRPSERGTVGPRQPGATPTVSSVPNSR